jgi:hypothetical protein
VAAAWAGALAAVALIGTFAVRAAQHTGGVLQSQSTGRTAVAAAAATIKREFPAGPIALSVVAHGDDSQRQVTMGLAYALRTSGYTPQIAQGAFPLGPAYSDSGPQVRRVTVVVHDQGRDILVTAGGPNRPARRAT